MIRNARQTGACVEECCCVSKQESIEQTSVTTESQNAATALDKEIALLVRWWGEQFSETHERITARRRALFEDGLDSALRKRLSKNPVVPVEVVVKRDFVSSFVRHALKEAGVSGKHQFSDYTVSRLAEGEVGVQLGRGGNVVWLMEKTHV